MPTIRITVKDKQTLDQICATTNMSQPDVFHKAIRLLAREALSDRIRGEFEALAEDPTALESYRNESRLFDQAGPDGIIDPSFL